MRLEFFRFFVHHYYLSFDIMKHQVIYVGHLINLRVTFIAPKIHPRGTGSSFVRSCMAVSSLHSGILLPTNFARKIIRRGRLPACSSSFRSLQCCRFKEFKMFPILHRCKNLNFVDVPLPFLFSELFFRTDLPLVFIVTGLGLPDEELAERGAIL